VRGQCTFVDAEGRRCSERRFLTFEHRHPFAFGGLPTVYNLILLCKPHNLHTARQVFGEEFLADKRTLRTAPAEPAEPEPPPKPDVFGKLLFALCNLGFRRKDVTRALSTLRLDQKEPELEPLLRAALTLLTPVRT
jgi:hypothetical protein